MASKYSKGALFITWANYTSLLDPFYYSSRARLLCVRPIGGSETGHATVPK